MQHRVLLGILKKYGVFLYFSLASLAEAKSSVLEVRFNRKITLAGPLKSEMHNPKQRFFVDYHYIF